MGLGSIGYWAYLLSAFLVLGRIPVPALDLTLSFSYSLTLNNLRMQFSTLSEALMGARRPGLSAWLAQHEAKARDCLPVR